MQVERERAGSALLEKKNILLTTLLGKILTFEWAKRLRSLLSLTKFCHASEWPVVANTAENFIAHRCSVRKALNLPKL